MTTPTMTIEEAMERASLSIKSAAEFGQWTPVPPTALRLILDEVLKGELADVKGPQFTKRAEAIAANWRSKVEAAEAHAKRLQDALRELKTLGEVGMKPDYREWLTFHDKVAQIATAALGATT